MVIVPDVVVLQSSSSVQGTANFVVYPSIQTFSNLVFASSLSVGDGYPREWVSVKDKQYVDAIDHNYDIPCLLKDVQ